MRTLVTYYSLTGNTGKVTAAIHTEASQISEAELNKIEDIKPDSMGAIELNSDILACIQNHNAYSKEILS